LIGPPLCEAQNQKTGQEWFEAGRLNYFLGLRINLPFSVRSMSRSRNPLIAVAVCFRDHFPDRHIVETLHAVHPLLVRPACRNDKGLRLMSMAEGQNLAGPEQNFSGRPCVLRGQLYLYAAFDQMHRDIVSE
jgi:hypothetical protein